MNIGNSIRILRKDKKITQHDFSKMIGITQSYLSLIESDKKKPSIDVLEKIEERFNVSLVVLLWFAFEEKHVPDHKKETYKIVKPLIDNLIKEVW